MAKILKFSEYRQEQALWIQREAQSKIRNKYFSMEEFLILRYIEYLDVCGFKQEEAIIKMESLSRDMWIPNAPGKKLKENINSLMDALMEGKGKGNWENYTPGTLDMDIGNE